VRVDIKSMARWALAPPLLGLALLGLVFARAGDPVADAEGGAAQVLVLGSGGLVGRTLVAWLEARNYSVLHVRNRRHIDLRVPGALDVFNSTRIAYAFFLACEVGGSKFIESSARDLQLGIIESNVRMYQVVFPWLAAHKVPFTFTSSYLQVRRAAPARAARSASACVRSRGWRARAVRREHVPAGQQRVPPCTRAPALTRSSVRPFALHPAGHRQPVRCDQETGGAVDPQSGSR
jgi:hypothetical protein